MKNDEDLLDRIGAHAREDREGDDVWERVARGEASDEELAELERRAETDEDVAAMLAATRPLGPDAEARIAAKIAPPAAPSVVPITAARKKRPLLRFSFAYVGPVALAAAVLLYVVAGRHGEDGPELPLYGVTATGQQAMRGPAEGSTRLRLARADARFEIVLRPATAASEKVVAYAFGVGEGEPFPVDANVEIAPEGSVRLRGSAKALTGAREIRVVVGAPTAIGRFEDALTRARSNASSSRVRVLGIPIDRE